MSRRMRPLADRFWDFVSKGEGCWLWRGGTNGKYGVLGRGGRGAPMVYAHRLSYELAHGEVPSGLYVMHSCDTPLCVRPEHLAVGTQTDNMRDAMNKGRISHVSKTPGEKNRHAKLTAADVGKIRERLAQGETRRSVAATLGMNPHTISRIALRQLWPHVA